MLKSLYSLFIFLLTTVSVTAQVNKSDSVPEPPLSPANVVKIQLTDGTSILGVQYAENVYEIVVQDFNAGRMKINRKVIRSYEKTILDSTVVIETVSSSVFIGKVIEVRNGCFLVHSNTFGFTEIKLNSIARVTDIKEYNAKNKEGRFANPNATRYLFAPSAIPLKKGEGYYQNAYLLANSVNAGVTKNISVGGGVVIPLLFYVTPKISFKAANNLYLGAGVLFTQSFLNEFDLSAGIGYGLATVGNHEHNFTIGSGYGMAKMNKEYRNTPMPIITVNGMARISRKLSLITENWLIPRGGYNLEEEKRDSLGGIYGETRYVNKNFYSFATSLGLRLMPGIKTSVDFSVVCLKVNPNNNVWFLPYLDFVYKFD